MNDDQPQIEALSVKDGKICKVGTFSEVMETAGANTECIYLDNKTMLPGFIEAHQHAILNIIQTFYTTDIRPIEYIEESEEIKFLTSKEIINRIHNKLNVISPDSYAWDIFFGWDPELIQDLPRLTADYIDKTFSKDIPIFI